MNWRIKSLDIWRVYKKPILIGATILLVAVIGYYGYGLYREKMMADPVYRAAQTEKLVKKVVGEVEKIMILPTQEIPTVATITDAAKLKSEQAFYIDAENGDQLLIYVEARKAIIYRPSRKLIVNAGPIFSPDGENGDK